MEGRLFTPVRTWGERRELRRARRRADVELASTRLPSPRLAWRVRELVAEDNRVSLARSITDALHAADERLLPSASPLDRGSARACRAELLTLASRLCALERPVTPRGVLLVERLLTDPASPLFGHNDPRELRAAIARSDAALAGTDDTGT